jgi:ABC-type lipoprotein release transport system permease subunit
MYFPYVAKEVIRRKGRTVTNLLAVAVLIAMPVILTSIMNGYTAAFYLPFKSSGVDLVVEKSSETGDALSGSIRLPFGKGLFDEEEVSQISELEHVEDSAKALIVWQFDQGKFITVEGLDPESFIGEKLKAGVTSGRFLEVTDGDGIVVEKHFAKFYGAEVGDDLPLGNSTFHIVGVVTAEEESQVSAQNVYMNLADAQRLLGVGGYSQLYLRLDNLSSETAVRSAISNVDSQAVVMSGSSIASSLSNAVSVYNRFRTLGAAILILVVAFILFQVSASGLLSRRREIGAMQSVGWTQKDIRRQVISEVIFSTLLGCILGVIASLIVVAAIGSVSVQASLPGALSNELSSLTADLKVSLSTAAEFSGLAFIVSVVVSLILGKRISRIKPLANIRS